MKFIFLLILSSASYAQTIYLPNIKATETGTIDSGLASANVHITNATLPGPAGGATAANQVLEIAALNDILDNQTNGTQVSNSIQSGVWSVGRTWTLSESTDSVTSFTNDGAGNAITSTLGALDVFISGGSLTVSNPSVGLNGDPIPLSSTLVGGSDGTDLIPLSVSSTGVLAVDGSGSTQPVSGTVTVVQPTGSNLHVEVDASALPTGAATETTLSSINGKLPATLGQKTMANSMAVVIASDQSAISTSSTSNTTGSGTASTVSTVQTLTAPANAVGFILMNLDTSTTNMRWAVGRVASTSVGQQLQPGRSSDFVPVGANVSIIAESGTCNFDIQWVSQ